MERSNSTMFESFVCLWCKGGFLYSMKDYVINEQEVLQHCWLFYTFAAHWWGMAFSVRYHEAARMVESVDTKDLKSFGQWWLCGFKSRFEYFDEGQLPTIRWLAFLFLCLFFVDFPKNGMNAWIRICLLQLFIEINKIVGCKNNMPVSYQF